MSQMVDQLKGTLANLSVPERAELADYLLESLETPDEGVAEAWRQELQSRTADIRAGKVEGEPIEGVLHRLRERYP
jgi:putative addiction module component (TIGR02574 family)